MSFNSQNYHIMQFLGQMFPITKVYKTIFLVHSNVRNW